MNVRGVIVAVRIPDSVCELSDGCFKQCRRLVRVTFSSSSPLEWVGASCSRDTRVDVPLEKAT